MQDPKSDSLEHNRLCYHCVGETFLSGKIRHDGNLDFCFYCDSETETLSIRTVADLVEQAFEEHYERTASEPDAWEYAMHSEWEREGVAAKWAILNAADVSEEIADDIRSVLEDRHYDHDCAQRGEECPFDEESYYLEKDAGHGEFLMMWTNFENGLKTQARFFSPSAKVTLDQIFDRVAELQTRRGTPVVVTAGPEMPIATLYRARVFAGEDEKLKEALKAPWKHVGNPPYEAAGAGRMNARGIGVFYGAIDPETALSEVRPPVGSNVVVARFDITRSLRLLDLGALKSVAAGGSIFDPATLVRMQHANFLEVLSSRLSCPVMPHEEIFEYLPTQAVADYLANVARLDGIIFPSIQTGQEFSNIVLFHHAARVVEVAFPRGTKVDVQLETQDSDGVYPDYIVWEKVPPSPAQDKSRSSHPHWRLNMSRFFDSNIDMREPTLSIDLKTINVHHVRAVTFDAPSHVVMRHRFEQTHHHPEAFDSPAMKIEGSLENPFE